MQGNLLGIGSVQPLTSAIANSPQNAISSVQIKTKLRSVNAAGALIHAMAQQHR